jgi:hypothetical protein
MINLRETFDRLKDEYIKFDRVEEKLHPRPDMCAFLLLDKLAPGRVREMICAAEHDEIWLDVDCDLLAQSATESDILMLTRCGVRYDVANSSLSMFV